MDKSWNSGSHEELLAADGLYATLHSLQFQDADPNNRLDIIETVNFMNDDPHSNR